MKENPLFTAISETDPQFLRETERVRQKGKRRRRQLVGSAGALCLLCLLGGGWLLAQEQPIEEIPVSSLSSTQPSGQGVTIPESQGIPGDGALSSFRCPSLFYEGREYCGTAFLSDDSLLSTRLGTVETPLGEIEYGNRQSLLSSPAWETYYEPAGTTAGDFFSVEGYDPEFLLCMEESGQLRLFLSGEGRTFFTGEDLFGKLFSAKGRVKRLALGTDSESLSGESEDFLQALCQSPAIPKSEIPEEIPREMVLELTDGVSLPLELYSNGYVVLSGLWEVGFQMEKTDFSPWFQQIPPVE